MIVLIAKQNENVIRQFHPNVKFKESTRNTCTFQITQKKFDQLYNDVKLAGYNPYALMYFG